MSAKVTLLTYTPNPEMTVAMAAKLCYSPSEISNIRDGLTEEKTADFIDMLANIGHGSPFEHASFTFGIEGISRACSHQMLAMMFGQLSNRHFKSLLTSACKTQNRILQSAVAALC